MVNVYLSRVSPCLLPFLFLLHTMQHTHSGTEHTTSTITNITPAPPPPQAISETPPDVDDGSKTPPDVDDGTVDVVTVAE